MESTNAKEHLISHDSSNYAYIIDIIYCLFNATIAKIGNMFINFIIQIVISIIEIRVIMPNILELHNISKQFIIYMVIVVVAGIIVPSDVYWKFRYKRDTQIKA